MREAFVAISTVCWAWAATMFAMVRFFASIVVAFYVWIVEVAKGGDRG